MQHVIHDLLTLASSFYIVYTGIKIKVLRGFKGTFCLLLFIFVL